MVGLPCLSLGISFIRSFSEHSLIASLPGPVLEVRDREGNGAHALLSRSSLVRGRTLITGAMETQRGPLSQPWGPAKSSWNAQVIPLELGGE